MTGYESASILPPLNAAQSHQSAAVVEAVAAAVRAAGGWLPFDDYLRLVLYAPGLGYYSAGAAKIGAEGDFVTAPELSGLFGRCLARTCGALLSGGGEVLELGAGTGALAATLLPALESADALPRRYRILEISADLRARQRQTLASLAPALRERVQWIEQLPPEPLDGVILANEVADALPFQWFCIAEGRGLERGVGLDPDGRLRLEDRSARPAVQAELRRMEAELSRPWPAGYCSELCLLLDAWVRSLAATLSRGLVLIIDYGLPRREYYHPQRSRGTLRCQFRHRVHEDVLRHPGLQDISAWVDFTRVAEAASEAGLTVAGYCTQAALLLATGIEQELAAAASAPQRARLASEARTLLLPGEMGENVKAMALTRGRDEAPPGFELQDLRRLL